MAKKKATKGRERDTQYFDGGGRGERILLLLKEICADSWIYEWQKCPTYEALLSKIICNIAAPSQHATKVNLNTEWYAALDLEEKKQINK